MQPSQHGLCGSRSVVHVIPDGPRYLEEILALGCRVASVDFVDKRTGCLLQFPNCEQRLVRRKPAFIKRLVSSPMKGQMP